MSNSLSAIEKLEQHVGRNAICINDYNQREHTFSNGAIEEINKAFERLTAELEQYRQAEMDGRLQIINKALFCRNASKRDGRCAGYHENMFSHATLRMCAECGKYDPSADEADYYEDIGEDHEDNG